MSGLGRRIQRLAAAGVMLSLLAGDAGAAEPRTLRVGTSGDYAPFSTLATDGTRAGLDIRLLESFAAQRDLALEWVDFRWPDLARDLAAGRFDLAASGITVRADRSLIGGFTVPYATTGAVVLARREAALTEAALREPGRVLAVNAGGHLERVARLLFPAAEIHAIADNRAVIAALRRGEVEAVVTDSAEAPSWEAGDPRPDRFGPFTRDQKAFWVSPSERELASELSAWLVDRETDGTLKRARAAVGLAGDERPGLALHALVTAIAERLALMPAVAEAKRRDGTPVHVPEREAIVIASAVESARKAARAAGLPGAEDEAVAAFFGELVAAARAVQEAVLAGPPAPPGEVPDLDTALRPALVRIGDRIGVLLPRLPGAVSEPAVDRALAQLVDLPGVDAERRRRLVAAISALAAAPRR